MRRVLAMLMTTSLLIASGCGGKIYGERLQRTLEDMKYRARLDDQLIPAPTKGRLELTQIFLRPPKNMQGPTKDFALTVLEPGRFDVAETYFEPNKANLHVLARVKTPKNPAEKKPAAPAPDPTLRGDFTQDVIAILNGVYNLEIDATKAKPETKRLNTFKKLVFEGNGKNVQAYIYGDKNAAHQVALIFEYPKAEQNTLASKIDLSLESFAVGARAQRAFGGAIGDEEPAEVSGAAAAF